MEDRLGHRGTIAVGALAITAIFMIAVTCLASIIAEYNRYAYAVKTTSEKLLMRGKERLTVEQASNMNIKVRNEGSATSFVIAVFAVNPANNNIRYVRLDAPIPIKILSTKVISLPEAIPESWNIAILTAYGNIFWEES